MGLYGDKLTLGSGTAVDSLAKSAGTSQDNLLHYNSLLTNGDFEGVDVDGLGAGWTSTAGIPSIQTGSINGRSQRITAGESSTINLYQDIIILPNPEMTYMSLSFKLKTNSSGTLRVWEEITHKEIYKIDLSEVSGTLEVEVQFKATDITRLYFEATNMLENNYFEVDDVVFKALNQDNLTYTI